MSWIYDMDDENEFVLAPSTATLLERRRENRIYIPEKDLLPDYSYSPEQLRNLFAGVIAILDRIPNNIKTSELRSRILGYEVGDDRVDVSNDPLLSAIALLVQETVLGMSTSVEDTGITNDLWNFCEVTTGAPCSRANTYGTARKSDNFKNLDFVDSPPIRVIIDTTKSENMHATSYTGKVSILGSKMRSSNAICSSYLEVANLLQDGMLATWKGSEPKYLPSTLGGCHCPAPYADSVNVYLYMKSFRGGGYDRLYGTAVEEAIEAIRLNEDGVPTPVVISEVLRDNDDYYFATFDNLVAVPDTNMLDGVDTGLPPPLYERLGVKNEVVSVEARLVQAKRLVTRTNAMVELNRSNRIRNYIFSSTDILCAERCAREQSLRRRKAVNLALRGNTAFINLVNRTGSREDITTLFKQKWRPCVKGQPEFSLRHAVWLTNGARGDFLNLFDLPSSSDMFLRSEVSLEESLKVSGIQLNVQGSKSWIPQTTIARVGLYEISKTMEQWCDDKIVALTDLRAKLARPLLRADLLDIFTKNTEWVNDDTSLIERCIHDTGAFNKPHVALVSNDKKLARKMSIQSNCIVVRIDPICLPRVFPEKQWREDTEVTPAEVYSKFSLSSKTRMRGLQMPEFVYIDTGSVHAVLSKMEQHVNECGMQRLYTHSPISSGRKSGGQRYEEYKRTEVFLSSDLLTEVYTPDKGRRTRQRKPLSRDSGSSSRHSWSTASSLDIKPEVTRRITSFRTVSEKSA